MGFFSRLFSITSGDEEREHAEALGIVVDYVERDLPRFSRFNGTVEIHRGSCARYAVPRRGFEPRTTWSFLQRTAADGAQFPNDYLLIAGGELPPGLRELLHQVAEEYDEELFEFEGTAQDVAVYWVEQGGTQLVEQLDRLLKSLAAY